MPSVPELLTRGMDSTVRGQITRRADSMIRQLRYLKDTQNTHFKNAEQTGWTIEKLEAVCWLNSFFQIVVSPLAASAITNSLGLGGEIPINYGDQLVFNSERRGTIGAMQNAFYDLCAESEIEWYMLSAHHAENLVYLISSKNER